MSSSLPFFVALVGTYRAMRVPCIVYGGASFLAMTCLLVELRGGAYAAPGRS